MHIFKSLRNALGTLGLVSLLAVAPAWAGVGGGSSTVNINIDSSTVETTQVNQIINDVILESLWKILGETERRTPNQKVIPPMQWELEATVTGPELATALAAMRVQLQNLASIPGRKGVYHVVQDEAIDELLELVSQSYEEVVTGQETSFSETVDTGGAVFGVDYIGDPYNYFTWIAIGPNSVNVQVDQVTTTTTFVDATTTNEYNQVAVWQVASYYKISPILLDMNGTGTIQASGGEWLPRKTIDGERLAFFDFHGDKFPVLMEWPGPEDGILCRPNSDGSVDGTNLFGTATGFKDGFEALKALDKNGDGKLTGEELKGLAVWIDSNSDARPQTGEIKSLAEHGITELSLTHKNYVSSFVRDGVSYRMFDWWPQVFELNRVKVVPKSV